MVRGLQCLTSSIPDKGGTDANPFNQGPRKRTFYQELGLFGFHSLTPVPSSDSAPVDPAQAREQAKVLCMRRRCVGQCEGPPPFMPVGPVDCLAQVRLQVDDRSLTAGIGKLRVISLVDQVEHDRAWAEVERNAVADTEVWVRPQGLNESSFLDRGHTDGRARTPACLHFRIAPDCAVRGDRGQTVDMQDVIDLRAMRHRRRGNIILPEVLPDDIAP